MRRTNFFRHHQHSSNLSPPSAETSSRQHFDLKGGTLIDLALHVAGRDEGRHRAGHLCPCAAPWPGEHHARPRVRAAVHAGHHHGHRHKRPKESFHVDRAGTLAASACHATVANASAQVPALFGHPQEVSCLYASMPYSLYLFGYTWACKQGDYLQSALREAFRTTRRVLWACPTAWQGHAARDMGCAHGLSNHGSEPLTQRAGVSPAASQHGAARQCIPTHACRAAR